LLPFLTILLAWLADKNRERLVELERRVAFRDSPQLQQIPAVHPGASVSFLAMTDMFDDEPGETPWAYHATHVSQIPNILAQGLLPHLPEQVDDQPVGVYFAPTPGKAQEWNHVTLAFPVPNDTMEDPWSEGVTDEDGNYVRSSYYSEYPVPVERILIFVDGRWRSLTWVGERVLAERYEQVIEKLLGPRSWAVLTAGHPDVFVTVNKDMPWSITVKALSRNPKNTEVFGKLWIEATILDEDDPCHDHLIELESRMGIDLVGSYHWVVRGVQVAEDERRRGIGQHLYLAAVATIADLGGGMLMPDECVAGGSTSMEAQGMHDLLKMHLDHFGSVLVIPNLQGVP